MSTPLVIEHFEMSNNSLLASPQLGKRSASSLLSDEKNASMTALT